ncbi:UDP-glucosyl transferase 76E1 [Actinidia rufa]|uniref:UDP-glucosyl transferase 76E1 n=1 Tax=Actinidia rufa TaxID=165716 RepID=A0A7J0HDB2_9ERIC|nr:UDP-glucosyl transferase 76E1 [Actinidia rufa]
MEALAYGLERSNVRFIWVVSGPGSGRGIVLKGWTPTSYDIESSSSGWVFESLRVEFSVGGSNGQGDDTGLAHRGAIALAMSGDVPQRLRVEELRGKAIEAIREDGSSSKDLDGLVRALAQLQVKQWE